MFKDGMPEFDSIEDYQLEIATTHKEHAPLNEAEAKLLDWAIGLGGESGEVLELVKHNVFHKEPMDRVKLTKELGDVMWYVSAIATANNINLAHVVDFNIQKLRHRYKTGYNHKDSALRHQNEERFEDTEQFKILRAAIMKGD